jgi:polar amino acid transport system substrate-binding protein
MNRAAVVLATCLIPWGPGTAQAQTLTLHYQERPPYSETGADGGVHGLVADPAAAALERAGIAFQWALTPSQRQLALVQSGRGLQCGVGWYRTAERAALGRYSAPLYQDRPLAALVRAGAVVDATLPASALLADPALRLLVKDGYSYGPQLDRLIAGAARPPLRTTVEPVQMSRMLRSGRADWMIVSPEEAEVLQRVGQRVLPLADAPEGPTRHLYCSADVPAAWLARIDAALAARRR